MSTKEVKEIHLKAFLEKRQIPESVIDAVYGTPLAPELLFEFMLSVWQGAESFGAANVNPYLEQDKAGSEQSFLDFIQNPTP